MNTQMYLCRIVCSWFLQTKCNTKVTTFNTIHDHQEVSVVTSISDELYDVGVPQFPEERKRL